MSITIVQKPTPQGELPLRNVKQLPLFPGAVQMPLFPEAIRADQYTWALPTVKFSTVVIEKQYRAVSLAKQLPLFAEVARQLSLWNRQEASE